MSAIGKKRNWFILEGVLLCIIAIIALALPGLFPMQMPWIFAILTIVTGVIVCFRALATFKIKGL